MRFKRGRNIAISRVLVRMENVERTMHMARRAVNERLQRFVAMVMELFRTSHEELLARSEEIAALRQAERNAPPS